MLDRAHAGTRKSGRQRARGLRCWGLEPWDTNAKPCASERARSGVDGAAMLDDDLLHDGKTETRALGLGRHVGIENRVAHGLRYARSVVVDGDAETVVLG